MSGSLKTDQLQLDLIINGDPARKALNDLNKEAKQIQESLKGVKKDSDEWIKGNARLSEIRTEQEKINSAFKITDLTLKELIKREKELKYVRDNAPPNTPEWAQYNKELKEVSDRKLELMGKSKMVSNALGEQSGVMGKLRSTIVGAIAGFTALITAGAGVISFFKSSIQGAIEDEKAERQLYFALDQNTEKLGQYLNIKRRFMATTLFQETEIYSALNFAAAMGRNAEQAEKMLKAAGGLATVTGTDLNTAMMTLNGTLEGNIGKLGKYDSNLKSLTKEELANGAAIDLLSDKLGKFATSGLDTTQGAVDRFSKAFEELKDKIGETILKWLGFQDVVEGNQSTKKGKQEAADIAKFTSMGKEERTAYISGWQQEQDRYFALWQKAKQEENQKNREFYSIQFADTKAFLDKLKQIQEFNKADKEDQGKRDKEKIQKEITNYELLSQSIQEYTDLLKESVRSDPRRAEIYAEKIRQLEEEKKKLDELIESYKKKFTMEMSGTTSGGLIDLSGLPDSSGMQMPGEKMDNIENPIPGGEEDPAWKAKTDAIVEYADTALSILSQLDQAVSAMENAQLSRDAQVNEQKKANLKKQLDAKKITQGQYNQQVEKLDTDFAKKQRKIAHDQAVRQKELAIVQATINTLAGATKAWVDPGGVAGMALAIVIALLGALQIGLIASTPVPEAMRGRYKAAQAAVGRYFNVTGEEDGKLYSNVPYQQSFTGIPGRPLLVNETGNEIVIDPKTTKNIQMNYPGIIDAINSARVPQRAAGQYMSVSPTGGSSMPYVITMDPEYTAALKEHTEAIKKPLESVIVYDNFITEQNKVNKINTETSR